MPPFTPEDAAALHHAFVRDSLDKALEIKDARVELHIDIPSDAWSGAGVAVRLQYAGDLGLKMLHSLRVALEMGHPRALILGTDSPTLPCEYIAELLDADADVSLGPTGDGGFYGIAARRVHPAMFVGVEWSRADTLARTCEAIRSCGLTVSLGSLWYDVDGPADLIRLRNEAHLPPNTSRWIQEFDASVSGAHP